MVRVRRARQSTGRVRERVADLRPCEVVVEVVFQLIVFRQAQQVAVLST